MLLKKNVSAVDYRDTAMAFLLLCFLFWLLLDRTLFLYIGLGILLLAMIAPKSMKYPAMVWLGLSNLLGSVISKVILAVLYLVLVAPVGLVRRLMGKDAMGLKGWRNGEASAFVARDHRYTGDELHNQF